MKIVFIAYGQNLDDEVTDILVDNMIANFTKWKRVGGVGQSSGVHRGKAPWPKLNNVMMLALGEDEATKVMDGVRQMRRSRGASGVKAFLVPCEEVT